MAFWKWLKKNLSFNCRHGTRDRDNISIRSMRSNHSRRSVVVRPLDDFMTSRCSL